ncbi:MAG: alpha/beta hydrolase-fold protein [Candidatus Sumerlaeia bacterium]|nr:alpha/beta hydrolase-fold protein [Candidatus Sumerlaeia bacterium]
MCGIPWVCAGLLALGATGGLRVLADQPVQLQTTRETSFGESVFVLGDHPLLGGGEMTRALKLSPHGYPQWSATVSLPEGTTVEYQFAVRQDSAAAQANPANGALIGSPLSLTVPGQAEAPRRGFFRYIGSAPAPVLEIREGADHRAVALTRTGDGRTPQEGLWSAPVDGLPARGEWQFRVVRGDGGFDTPSGAAYYTTALASPWLQDRQLFNYRPAPAVSAPRVVKIPNFTGSLPTRAVYVYLPRGYDQHTARRYPVLYMHDGQNCFQTFAGDSGFGNTWRADEAATALIAQGRMREAVIVGVSHGGSERIPEYLPEYDTAVIYTGRANQTAAYYINEVKPYIDANYRTLTGRDDTATAGSSMGGFFSTYLAWEYPSFARHHAALSPAYWASTVGGRTELIERMRSQAPRQVRLYLDSGTVGGGLIPADDGASTTLQARDALIENNYPVGPDFLHTIAYGADHTEPAWAARFPAVLQFLLPVSQEPEEATASGDGVVVR